MVMRQQILINVTPQETRVAVLEEGIVEELHLERDTHIGLVGNVYLGQVKRVLPGMQSAFIDIGLERTGFLHIDDLVEHRQLAAPESRIEQMLSEGQTLLVQVLKEPIGSKGARLSTQISLAGRFLVLLPQATHIGVSQRIEDAVEREQLKLRLQQLLEQQQAVGGYIVRTRAETATDAELVADVGFLNRIWSRIQTLVNSLPPKTLLFQDAPMPLRVLRDFVTPDTEQIVVDSRDSLQKMEEFAQQFVTAAIDRLVLYTGERPLFEYYGVETEIERALARRVDLKVGGYLVIDQTEALTTVDVNTGGFVGIRNFDETIFKTNLEAAQAIARQLRLRNLGGIILIDFIDMESEQHREAVSAELQKALAKDRTRITLNGFTQLGLMELTRKRTRESLAHILCEPCAVCHGRGQVKTAKTVCYEILRQILREARRFNTPEYHVIAGQAVIDLFLDEESQSLAQLSNFIAKPIRLHVETLYGPERFDVVLA